MRVQLNSSPTWQAQVRPYLRTGDATAQCGEGQQIGAWNTTEAARKRIASFISVASGTGRTTSFQPGPRMQWVRSRTATPWSSATLCELKTGFSETPRAKRHLAFAALLCK